MISPTFMVSVYNQQEHTFIGGEIGAYIERLAKESGRGLAVIRYMELGVFCIIEFLSPKRDVFVDVINLGNSLGNFDRAKAQELCWRLYKPVTREQTGKFISDGESAYYHDRQDYNESEKERHAKIERGE